MQSFKQRIISKKIEKELNLKDGVVEVDEIACDGCGVCVDACPKLAINIISFTHEQVKMFPFKGRLRVRIKGNKKAHINAELCVSCGLCMKHCHEFAIHKVKKTK